MDDGSNVVGVIERSADSNSFTTIPSSAKRLFRRSICGKHVTRVTVVVNIIALVFSHLELAG